MGRTVGGARSEGRSRKDHSLNATSTGLLNFSPSLAYTCCRIRGSSTNWDQSVGGAALSLYVIWFGDHRLLKFRRAAHGTCCQRISSTEMPTLCELSDHTPVTHYLLSMPISRLEKFSTKQPTMSAHAHQNPRFHQCDRGEAVYGAKLVIL